MYQLVWYMIMSHGLIYYSLWFSVNATMLIQHC